MFKLLKSSQSQIGTIIALLALLCVSGCGGSPQQRAQKYYEQGAKLLAQKDEVKAGIEFKNALQLNASLTDAWRGLAQIDEHNKNLRGLSTNLRKVVELDPKDVDARLKLARLMLMTNSPDDVLKMVDAALALNERSADALVIKAAALFKSNDPAGAIDQAQKALEIDHDNVGALIVLAAEKSARGDNRGALEILDRAPTTETNLSVEFFKIQLFEKLGDYQNIESLLQKLVKLYPNEPAFHRQLARLYVGQKRIEDAEKELRAIAAINPENIAAALDVVRFLSSARGAEAGKQELLAKIKSGDKVFLYEIALAEFEANQGHSAESIGLLEKLINDEKSSENILTAQAKLAELYYSLKNFNDAEKLAADILRKDARNINGLKIRAMIRLERRQMDPAISDLRQALNDQPRATDLMMLLGLAYERNGAIDLAEKQYAEATRASNFDPTVGLNYVGFLQRRGGGTRAEDVLSELAARWPTNVQILSALAGAKLARKDYVGAEEIAATLHKLGSNSEKIADQILGESLGARNKFDQSIEVLQSAYEQAPTSIQPMASLVRALIRAKKMDRALALLQDALKKEPDNASILSLLGSTQLLNNAPQDAEKSFKAAIERQPKNTIGYQSLANFLIQQQRSSEAIDVIKTGLGQLPGNVALRMMLASGYEVQHNFDEAIAEYESLLKDDPGSMIAANNLASLLTDQRTDKASVDRAYSLIGSLQKSQVPHFKDTIGWVYFRRGDYKAAMSQLEEASTELPNVAMVRYHLGETYIAVGEKDKAEQQFNQALNLAGNDSSLQQTVRSAMKRAGIH